MIALLVFWGAIEIAAWTYLLFPACLWLRARSAPLPRYAGEDRPTVSLVICAYNEEASIGARLENALALDYPPDRLEIIVASDGSTDETNAIVRAFASRGVRLLALPRQGKIPALNAAVASARGEVLVFSDANSIYESGALRALLRPFADPRIGGVAGDQRYLRSGRLPDGGEGERAYWDLDRLLKRWQGAAGSVTSSTGAIHAIRRELFRSVPSGVTDDFWVSTNVVAQGHRLVFAEHAAAWEPATPASGSEFRRKVRVITRGLRAVWLMRELLNPLRYGFYSVQLFSHKVLRRLAIVPMAAILLATPWLWNEGVLYRGAALVQLVFYLAALLGALLPPLESSAPGWTRRVVKLLALPTFFCMANAAAGLAALNVVRGHRIDSWEPQRGPSGAAST
jgi:cellulose synthase/poly-beta-1,6-N-acetylglucosamine synthase-like glycosyltransferase